MVGQDDLGPVRNLEARHVDAALLHAGDLFQQMGRVDDDAVADDAGLAGVEDAGRQQVQLGFDAFDDDGVAGVVSALVANDDLGLLRQVVDDFALAFVTPLGSHDDY